MQMCVYGEVVEVETYSINDQQWIFWTQADMIGLAIVDTGATKSMIGLKLAEGIQDMLLEQLGEDPIEMDYTKITRFTYAGGAKGQSIGKMGIEHPVALHKDKDRLWFNLVTTDSPMLLGLDYLDDAGAEVHRARGVLIFEDGHEEPLVRLPSGHLALQVL